MGELLVSDKKYSVEEYLELAAQAQEKLEFYNGFIIPMPGGTIAHNTIATNILLALGFLLEADPKYRIFNSDQRVWLPINNSFIYPDALVISGKPIPAEEDPLSITNPLVMFEVISKTTANYDSGRKFDLCQTLESFQEYVLVNQFKPEVLSYHREGPDLWRLSTVRGLENSLQLKSIGIEIPLERIYRNIEF